MNPTRAGTSAPGQVFEGVEKEFLMILNKVTGPENLTKEIEETGQIYSYITDCEMFQKFEHEKRMDLLEDKTFAPIKRFENHVDNMLKMSTPVEVIGMRFDDVVEIIEQTRKVEIRSFAELLNNMKNLKGPEVESMKTRSSENDQSRVTTMSDEDLFEEYNSPPRSVSKIPIKKVGGSASSKKRNLDFPSSKEMTKFTTPASKVFQFGANIEPQSLSKAPRYAKPGEQLLFSQTGSPVILPRLPRIPATGVPERIRYNDEDGNQMVEMLLFPTAEGKEKKFREFVTDMRGQLALKSAKAPRTLPPRLPRGGPASANKASSAKRWQP